MKNTERNASWQLRRSRPCQNFSCKPSAEGGLAHTSAEAQPRTVGHNRKRRRWFSRKYYASAMRIKEFYEDNIGKTFTGILSNALNKNFGRNH